MLVQNVGRRIRMRSLRWVSSSTGKSDKSRKESYKLDTLVTLGKLESDPHSASSVPIYQTATFDCRSQDQFDYTRSGNPTRKALEEQCARVERAERAFAFTSGMAALAASLRLLKPGDTVLACKDIYGGMHRLLMYSAKHSGINVEFVETWKQEAVEAAMCKGKVSMICLESPTNPQMRVSDIRSIARVARANDAYLLVDNSIMSPVLMNPLELGADLVIHSATKFLSGHSDVMAGVVLCNDDEIARQIAFVQNAEGSGLSPFDAWLVLRGIRTMALRVKAAQSNAIQIYEFLCNHPCVPGVNYLFPPGEAHYLQIDAHQEAQKRAYSNPEWEKEAKVHFSQAAGGGALLSFEMPTPEMSVKVVEMTKLFKNTVSFGSTSSLIEIPAAMSHASIPKEQQTMSPALIRLAIGIEDASDLINDLSQAISKATSGSSQPLARTISQSFPLGESLPPRDIHAVGVSMPTWDDVIRYEEGDVEVHSKLSSGYPRFVFLHGVKQLFARAEELFAGPNETAMVFPSARVSLRFQQFLDKPGIQCHDLAAHGAFAVTFPRDLFPQAKRFWQHTGEIPSSRLAAAILDVIDRTCYENAQQKALGLSKQQSSGGVEDDSNNGKYSHSSYSPREALKKRISSLVQQDSHNIYLYPTGMAALTAVQRLLKLTSQWDDKPLRTVIFGFPYLDTLKLAQLNPIGTGCVFLGHGDEQDIIKLEKLLEKEKISGLFVEFPSNPLLKAPDLKRLRKLADKHGFPIVVDDSCSGFCNVDLAVQGGADIVVTSLTKQFAGSGNVMGGSLILNAHSNFYDRLKSRLNRDHEELLFSEDAQVLLRSSSDLESRVEKSNQTALHLVNQLASNPLVEDVFHPSVVKRDLFDQFKREETYSGYGALLSVVLKNRDHSQSFFNKLDVAKGPGFGTNFTLVCPYTMIAHYHELDWARQYGVDSSLIRIWVGQEDERELLAKFDVALDTCCHI